MTTPLPEEEIGPGAVWRVGSKLALAGGTMSAETDYTLVKIDGDDLEIRAEGRTWAAPNQETTFGGAPALQESLSGKFTGTQKLALGRFGSTATYTLLADTAFKLAQIGPNGESRVTMRTVGTQTSKPGQPPAKK